jgi:hypothetical protein
MQIGFDGNSPQWVTLALTLTEAGVQLTFSSACVPAFSKAKKEQRALSFASQRTPPHSRIESGKLGAYLHVLWAPRMRRAATAAAAT